MAYTIDAARESRLDRVILSTDAPDYGELGRRLGAEVPFMRPQALATNEAAAISVVRHCLDWLEAEEGWVPDAVIYLQPSSPFRTARRIDAALALLVDGFDSVVSVRSAQQHPYYMFVPDGGGRLVEYVAVENRPERRQDLPPVYALDDSIMLSTTAFLRAPSDGKKLIVNLRNFRPLVLEDEPCVDINTEQDFLYAEFLMRRERREQP